MMKVTRDFTPNGERYVYDFKHCTSSKGWAQIDTGQDAWYFGTWANPFKMEIISYCEGDITTQQAETRQEFIDELRRIKEWNVEQGYNMAIDGMCKENIINEFEELGLSDLLH